MVIIIASLLGSGSFFVVDWGLDGVVYGWLWLFFFFFWCFGLLSPTLRSSADMEYSDGAAWWSGSFGAEGGLGLQTWLVL